LAAVPAVGLPAAILAALSFTIGSNTHVEQAHAPPPSAGAPSPQQQAAAPRLRRLPRRVSMEAAPVHAPSARPRDERIPSLEELEATWASEKDDEEWSLNASTFIRAMLDTSDAAAPRFTTRCGTTVCRADFEATQESLMDLAVAGRESGARFAFRRADVDGGSRVSVFFLKGAVDDQSAR
jgi:hypothetical protein